MTPCIAAGMPAAASTACMASWTVSARHNYCGGMADCAFLAKLDLRLSLAPVVSVADSCAQV